MKFMPQEIEVWYLLPALRKEITRILSSEYELNQKEISQILGITESAVSQYKKSKRGNELHFSEKDLKEIRKGVSKIINDHADCNGILYKLCVLLRVNSSLCDFHRKCDSSIDKNCDLCLV